MTISDPETMPPIEGGEAVQPHRGKLILILGILGLTCTAIPGIIAWILGKGDLKKMDQGEMDPEGRKLTTIGRTLGMVSIIWMVIVTVLVFTVFSTLVFGLLGMSKEVTTQETPLPASRPSSQVRPLPGAAGAPSAEETAAKEAAARVARLNQTAPSATPALPTATLATSAAMPVGRNGTYGGAQEANRPDPFVSQPAPYIKPPPPPTPVLPAIYNVMGGLRVQSTDAKRSVLRRTAGLVWNHEVYGLLEIGGETYIVRPGDKVENYLVSAITRDAIVLYSAELHKYIQVPLQGPSAERPEKQGAAPVASIDDLPAQPGVSEANGAGGEGLSPFSDFAPALPEGNSVY